MANSVAILSQTQLWTPRPGVQCVPGAPQWGACGVADTAPKAKRVAAKAKPQPQPQQPQGRDLDYVFATLREALELRERHARIEARRTPERVAELERRWARVCTHCLGWQRLKSFSGAFLTAIRERYRYVRLALAEGEIDAEEYARATADTRWQSTNLRTGERFQ